MMKRVPYREWALLLAPVAIILINGTLVPQKQDQARMRKVMSSPVSCAIRTLNISCAPIAMVKMPCSGISIFTVRLHAKNIPYIDEVTICRMLLENLVLPINGIEQLIIWHN